MSTLSIANKDRLRSLGISEYEIAYLAVENQKDYIPLLTDPLTPAKIIGDIAEQVTTVPLKLLVLKHPNVITTATHYILSRADNKPYQKQLIEAFLSNNTPLTPTEWVQMRKKVNKANRFDYLIVELLEEQNGCFTLEKLNVIFNTLHIIGFSAIGYIDRYILAIFNHTNFKVSILHGGLCKGAYIFNSPPLLNAINYTKNKGIISIELYVITTDVKWLPQILKDLFIF